MSTVLLSILALAGCDVLWGSSLKDNPQNCTENGSTCQAGAICNPATRRCEPITCSDGWCQENPLSNGSGVTMNNLRGIWGSAANNVWAVGDGGTILHWDGTIWRAFSSGTTNGLWSVWGSAANDVWAVGDGGTILHWDGNTWAPRSNGATSPMQHVRGVWGNNSDDVWAIVPIGGMDGVILHWNGSAWKHIDSGSMGQLSGIWGSAPNDVWAVANSLIIIHWDGNSWTSANSGMMHDLTAVWGSGARDVWTVGSGETVLHWNGASWTQVYGNSSTSPVLYGVWGSAASDIWTVGGYGAISHWDGGAWTHLSAGTINGLNGIWGSGPNDIWVVGDGGTILHRQLRSCDGNPGLCQADEICDPDTKLCRNCPTYDTAGGGGMNRPQVLVPGGMYSIENVPFTVADFYLDVFEVTVRAYRDCVSAGTCSKPATSDPFCTWSELPGSKEDYPISCVTWANANTFCQWAGRRLPTEEEWDYAAAGPQHSKYPWGNDDPKMGMSTQACWDRSDGTCPEDNGYEKTLLGMRTCQGIANLAGNVWEWTSSEYKEPFVHPVTMCSDNCSIRGGSWANYSGLPVADPQGLPPTQVAHDVGFRCARDAQ